MKPGIVTILLFLICGIQITSGQKTDEELKVKANELEMLECADLVTRVGWEFPQKELETEGYTGDQITKIQKLMHELGKECCDKHTGVLRLCTDAKHIIGLPDLESRMENSAVVLPDAVAKQFALHLAHEECGSGGTIKFTEYYLKKRSKFTPEQIPKMLRSLQGLAYKCCDTTKLLLDRCITAEAHVLIEQEFGGDVDFTGDGYPVLKCKSRNEICP